MPYSGIDDPDLPQNIQDMSDHKRKVFVGAFNNVMENCKDDDPKKCEQRAFAIATSAAQDADKGIGEKQRDGYIFALPFRNHAGLMGLQQQIASLLPDGSTLVPPAEFHITLVYVADGGEVTVPEGMVGLVEDLQLEVDYVESFTTPKDGVAVVARLERSDKLNFLQSALYFAAVQSGVSISPFSIPANFRPHITLAYGPEDTNIWHNLGDPLLLGSSQVTRMVDGQPDELVKSLKAAEQGDSGGLLRWLRKQIGGILAEREEPLQAFKVLEDGTFIALYTNAFKDREGEYFTTDGIKADIDHMNTSGMYPELWFWHLPGTKHGQVTGATTVGRFAMAWGKLDDTPLGEAFKAYYERTQVEMSHGFLYNASKKVGPVFHDWHTFEITTIPAAQQQAANGYTFFAVKSTEDTRWMAKQPTNKQVDGLIEAVGEERANQILQAALEKSKELEGAVDFKQKEAEEGGDEEVTLKMIGQQIAALTESLKAMKPMKDEETDDEDMAEDDEEDKSLEATLKAALAPLSARLDKLEGSQQTMQGLNIGQLLQDELRQGQSDRVQDGPLDPLVKMLTGEGSNA